ncbi:ABC transporter permease [Agromyces aerolatus]|uniref:ABC transporter permease n=1 Tax=Agromyces sp. LY-1074 TaxID=3074080 RepID=UPI00285C886E|nr:MULTISPECIES: ABC transporter permease [unclassified Agromyces]MDR5700905.1 ABC transporter permease [Agromyces sp. LY-1074]MDR5707434.1 ABC transporter permease [Agromyces sp. LY-1358]
MSPTAPTTDAPEASAIPLEPTEPDHDGYGKRAGRVIRNAALGLLGFVIIIAFWWVASEAGWMRPGLVPAPATVAQVMWDGLVSGSLLNDLLVSARRVTIGLLVGMVLAIPIGFLLGWFPGARVTFNPIVNFFRALPPIALVPLVVIYFGIGELAREVILIYAAFFATIIIVYEGVAAIEEKYVRAGQTLGASRLEVFAKIVFPLSLPHIFTAARVSLGIAWSSLVAAELVAAQDGLGAAIQNASNFLDVPRMYAGIILIGIAALVMDLIIRVIAARVLRWQDRGER